MAPDTHVWRHIPTYGAIYPRMAPDTYLWRRIPAAMTSTGPCGGHNTAGIVCAIFDLVASSTEVDCIFPENSAGSIGRVWRVGGTVFTDCLFTGNSATSPNGLGAAAVGDGIVGITDFLALLGRHPRPADPAGRLGLE